MSTRISRRDVIKRAGVAAAGALIQGKIAARGIGQGSIAGGKKTLQVAGRAVEFSASSVSPRTVRIILQPIGANGQPQAIEYDGALVKQAWSAPRAKIRSLAGVETIRCGDVVVRLSAEPLTVRIETRSGRLVQQLRVDDTTAAMSFLIGDGPVFGLGEGGPQFDRRGSHDAMRSGQGGYRLRTNGGRVPVPWLIGTSGWAMFVHQPYGTFDLTGRGEGRFQAGASKVGLPLDVFIVAVSEPAQAMAEYARLTGYPEMPPLWSLGYQQSHRTLAGREEILGEAQTFRGKKLPCDALIYLGTGFCPSGWNTQNGAFEWNSSVFPDPEEMIRKLHEQNFKFVPHVVILTKSLRGAVQDKCDPAKFNEEEAGCYWDKHRKLLTQGVDGWWPDEGDPLNQASRLARIRMYWDGTQLDRPNQRLYALHRNGYAGMQRYTAFLWSGDVYSTWETLRTHIPVAINTALTGIPYWGTDTGGFVPTKELTGELYVRWFQFSSFCMLFRSHGRAWKLRLPWGWNTGETGPTEISNYGDAALPDASELHNPNVEPICRKYLELRYQLMPYLYSAVREAHDTGLPIMRALWLHYPADPVAVSRDDEYLWGRDILVAPVAEKGATSRKLYLPRGHWYDFWTQAKVEGGQEISRDVDLSITPLYVRAGAILPMGPVKQYTGEKVEGPLTTWIYPGADGQFMLYEDDGSTLDYRKGEWMGIRMAWTQRTRKLSLRLAGGSRMLPPLRRPIEVRLASEDIRRSIVFEGHPIEISL
jgi:alpha-glucosidase/alpha-D-xyloside xylohydrolase